MHIPQEVFARLLRHQGVRQVHPAQRCARWPLLAKVDELLGQQVEDLGHGHAEVVLWNGVVLDLCLLLCVMTL